MLQPHALLIRHVHSTCVPANMLACTFPFTFMCCAIFYKIIHHTLRG